jgi:putative transposase
MFTSALWRRTLRFFGIHHQRSAVGCPWQNGRIERFFGTLKPVLRQLELASQTAVQSALDAFGTFYNEVRPHQNLGGLTPAEAWRGWTWEDVHRVEG